MKIRSLHPDLGTGVEPPLQIWSKDPINEMEGKLWCELINKPLYIPKWWNFKSFVGFPFTLYEWANYFWVQFTVVPAGLYVHQNRCHLTQFYRLFTWSRSGDGSSLDWFWNAVLMSGQRAAELVSWNLLSTAYCAHLAQDNNHTILLVLDTPLCDRAKGESHYCNPGTRSYCASYWMWDTRWTYDSIR